MAAATLDIPLMNDDSDSGKVFSDIGEKIVDAIQTLTEKSAKGWGSIQNAVLESAVAVEGWNKSLQATNSNIEKFITNTDSSISGFFGKMTDGLANLGKNISSPFVMLGDQIGALGTTLSGTFSALPPPSLKKWFARKEKKKGQEDKDDKIWSKVLNSKWFDKTLGFFKNMLSGMGDMFMDLLIFFIAMAIFDPSGSLMMSILQFLLSMIVMVGNMLIAILPSVIAMIPPIIAQFATGLVNAIVMLVPMISTIIKMLIGVALTLIDSIIANLPQVLDALITGIVSILTDPKIINGVLQVIIKIVLGLATGIVMVISSLAKNLPMIIETLVMAITTALPVLIEAITPLLPIIVEQLGILIIRLIPVLIKAYAMLMPAYFKSVGTLIKGSVQGLINIISKYIGQAMVFVGGLVDDVILSIKGIFSEMIASIKKLGKMLFKTLLDPFMSIYSLVANSTLSMFNRLYQYMGPASMFGKVMAAITGLLTSMSGISDEILEAIDLGKVYRELHDTFDKFIKWLTEDSAIGKLIKGLMDAVGNGAYSASERDKMVYEATQRNAEADAPVKQTLDLVAARDAKMYEGVNEKILSRMADVLEKRGALKDVDKSGKIDKNDLIAAYQEGNKNVVKGVLDLLKETKLQKTQSGQELFIASPAESIKLR